MLFRNSRPRSPRAAWIIGSLVIALGIPGCSQRVVPPLEPPTTVRRGDDAFRYQDYESAIQYYKAYLDRTWHGDYTSVAAYQCAVAQYRLKRYQDCIGTLNDLQSRYPDTQWVQVQALRGDAERALGNDTLAIMEWDEGWDVGNEADRDKLRLRIVTLAKRMQPDKLAQARTLVVHDEVRELLYPAAGGKPAPRLAAPMPEMEDQPPYEEPVIASPPSGSTAPRKTAPRMAVSGGEAGEPGTLVEIEPDPLGRDTIDTAPVEPETDSDEAGVGMAARGGAVATGAVAAESSRSPSAAASRKEETRYVPVEPPESESTTPETQLGAEANPAVVAAAPPSTFDATVSSDSSDLTGAKVGCLLPMSGRHGDLGQRAWRALQLAMGDEAQRLVLKDTVDDPAVTRRVLAELARDPRVVAVVGPITNDDAEAVAQLAAQDRMPLLLLSQEENFDGPFVLQVGMTRGELVDRLARYAVGKSKLKRFGVLYPSDANGKAFFTSFKNAIERQGGTIIGTISYPPGGDILPRYADTLFQWRNKQEVEALFLADTSVPAARLAGFLQAEMPDVTLLGAQGWETLAGEVAGARLNGVLFTDGFYVGSSRPATREFVELYRETYGSTPSALHARAYDAGTLVKRALRAGGGTRSDMLSQLRALGPVDGATGELQVTPQGLLRSVFLLRLYDGNLEEIGGSVG